MCKIEYEYLVKQYYDNEPPEDFGFVQLDHQPVVGEIIQLYWLDKKPAYKFIIDRITNSGLHGRSVKE